MLTSLAIACAAESVSTNRTPQKESSAQDVVARVNGTEITALQLKRAVETLLASKPDAKLSPETLKKVNNNMLESLISQELVYQAGLKLGVKDLDKQADEALAKEKARFVDDSYFQDFLRKNGMTEKELRDSFRNEIVVKNYIAETIDAKIVVSEDESKKFYDQNIDTFTTPEKVRVHHILIPASSDMSSDDKKKAREKAESLRKQLLDGADFAQLARDNSVYPSSKLGGDLGFISRKEVHPDFAKAAFALKTGELSEVVETPAGFQIIKLRDRSPSVTTSYSDAKPQIEIYLKNKKADAAFQKFLNEARKNAKIEMLNK